MRRRLRRTLGWTLVVVLAPVLGSWIGMILLDDEAWEWDLTK